MATTTVGNINITISALSDSTNHGPTLLCLPPQWYDLAVFFFANYFAHAASVISASGEPWFETLEVVLMALLFPSPASPAPSPPSSTTRPRSATPSPARCA
jgi:hypothetical protein